MAKDDVNPLSFILPAGVAAYVLSPEVRKAVRGAAVKGMAGLLELQESVSGLTGKVRGEVDGLLDEARKYRDEGRRSHEVSITVNEEPEGGTGPQEAGAPA